jgi:hypothetical protein
MDDAAALAMAQQRAAMAEEKLGELKTLLNDMRKDRDAWRDQAQGRLHPRLDCAISGTGARTSEVGPRRLLPSIQIALSQLPNGSEFVAVVIRQV